MTRLPALSQNTGVALPTKEALSRSNDAVAIAVSKNMPESSLYQLEGPNIALVGLKNFDYCLVQTETVTNMLKTSNTRYCGPVTGNRHQI